MLFTLKVALRCFSKQSSLLIQLDDTKRLDYDDYDGASDFAHRRRSDDILTESIKTLTENPSRASFNYSHIFAFASPQHR